MCKSRYYACVSALMLAGGEQVSLRKHDIQMTQLEYGPLKDALFSLRIGLAMFGLGMLDGAAGLY